MLNVERIAIVMLIFTISVCAVVLTRDAHGLLLRVDASLAQVERTSMLVSDYVERQRVILESPKNQKALEAGWQTPAVLNGTLKEVNRLILPRMMAAIDSLTTSMGSLEQSAQAVTSLVRNTDRSLNEGLLPNLAETAQTLGVSIQAITGSLQEIAAKSSMSVDEINELLADSEWKAALASIAATTAHVDAIAGNLEAASRQAPSIAESVAKIAKTSSKYQKLLLFAELLATIARAF